MAHSAEFSTLLNPRSIVFVGASDRSAFSRSAWKNLQEINYTGTVHLVSRNGGVVHGQTALKSCREIKESVDVGLVMVPIDAIVEVLHDLGVCGARFAIVLAGGFAETGEHGQHLQAEISQAARENGITLLGPNCLGFINFTQHVACWTGSIRTPIFSGPISVVSQSGAIATFLKHFAHQQGIGLHCVVSTGNEATLDLTAIAEHLIEDPHNKVIAMFIETIRDTKRFRDVAVRALQAGKPIVVLKVGRSELTAKAALSHTGAMVGDDQVFDAVCRQFGIVRVRSIEELVFTSELLAKIAPLNGDGVAFMSMSGGMGELGADYAHLEKISMPGFAPYTLEALRGVLPSFATPSNPLDLTGAAINEASIFSEAIRAVSADPGMALTVCIADVPTGLNEDWASHYVAVIEALGRCVVEAAGPVVVISNTSKYVSDRAREVVASLDLPYLASGADQGMRAVRHVLDWSSKFNAQIVRNQSYDFLPEVATERPVSEYEAMQYLASYGVPVLQSVLARNHTEAIQYAKSINAPVALKIASPDIAHKTEVGGVRLSVHGSDAIGSAFNDIVTAVMAARPTARIEGVLVSPMRTEGVELFASVQLDPQWGHFLTIGLGGVWIEALEDASLRLLPLESDDVIEMLHELRGSRLFAGYRGAPAVDVNRVADVVSRIGNAALGLGSCLDTLEVNPLLISGSRVEALDALATYRD